MLIVVELVALRAGLRALQHGHQSKHCSHVASPKRPTYSQTYPLGHLCRHRALQHILLLPVHLPVRSFGVLLDAFHWRSRLLSRHIGDHSSYLWVLCNHTRRRPRLLDPTSTSCTTAADGSQRKGCGHRRLGDGSYVSTPKILKRTEPFHLKMSSIDAFSPWRTHLHALTAQTQRISSHNRPNPLRPNPRQPVRLSLRDRRHRHLVLQRDRPRHHSSLLRRPASSLQRSPRFQPLPQLKSAITRRHAAFPRSEQRNMGPREPARVQA